MIGIEVLRATVKKAHGQEVSWGSLCRMLPAGCVLIYFSDLL